MDMYVAAGFEPAREAFGQGATDLGDGGGAFCAYVEGVPVVDLWGGTARPGQPWESDTRAVLMSLTKGLAALCVQILVDRGQVDVDAPVSAYWPEFAASGKEKVLVRHVLTHTAGVLSFPGEPELLGLDGTGWDDYDAIADGLAAATPSWEPGTRFGYHALTFGWLLGEIIRRVSGRRVGSSSVRRSPSRWGWTRGSARHRPSRGWSRMCVRSRSRACRRRPCRPTRRTRRASGTRARGARHTGQETGAIVPARRSS